MYPETGAIGRGGCRRWIERGLSAVRQNALRQTGSVKGVKDEANEEGGTRTSEVMGGNKAGRSKTTPLQQTCGKVAAVTVRSGERVAAGFCAFYPP